MWLPLLENTRGPRYLAIVEALNEDISGGSLRPGDRLPTHRDLARRLEVTVGTVSRAYQEAERRGLVSGEVGRGTFVRGEPEDLCPLTHQPMPSDVIDLAMNFPVRLPPELDPARALKDLAKCRTLPHLLDYQHHAGLESHRRAGAEWIARGGVDARPDRVLVCAGGQHAMMVGLSALTRPGDVVLTEEFTYGGMKAIAAMRQLRLRGLPMDEHGLRPDMLAQALRSNGARVLYLMPTLHNPTNAIMPEERRREIADVARAHDLYIIEDDIYGFLVEDAPPPISSFLPERSLYIISISKSLAPGLRIGYMLAPQQLVPRLTSTLWTTAGMACTLGAEVAASWIRDGTAENIVAWRRREARARHGIVTRVLDGLDAETHPSSYHVWLHLPDPWRSDDFETQAREQGVVICPADVFIVGRGHAPHAIRVTLGAEESRERLEQGLEVVAGMLARPPSCCRSIV